MSSVNKNSFFRLRIILVILCIISGTSLVLLATSSYGAGLSPDSVGYISIARQITEGNGYVDRLGQDVAIWPPLYPVILSVIQETFSVDPLQSTRYVNALLLGLVSVLTLWIMIKHLSIALMLVGVVWLMFAPPLLRVSTMAWSEPIFILFSICCLISLDKYLSIERTEILLLAGIFASLATLTRYIGVALIASSVLAILVTSKKPSKNRIIAGASFSFISATPLALWLLRNHFLTGTYMGDRAPSTYSLYENLYFTRNAIFGWFLPERLEPYYTLLFIVGVAVMILVVAFILKNRLSTVTDVPLFFSLCGYFVFYLGFLIISSTTTAYDQIGDRLLAPIYPVLLLIVLSVVQMLLRGISRLDFQRLGLYSVVGCLALWATLPVYKSIRFVDSGLENGYGYASKSWQNSRTLQALNETVVCTDLMIYSNRPEILYIHQQLEAYPSPRKTYYNSAKPAESLDSLTYKWPKTSPACLVWFQGQASYRFLPEELAEITEMTQISEADDGRIFLVAWLQ